MGIFRAYMAVILGSSAILAACLGSDGSDEGIAAAVMGDVSSPVVQALSGLIRTDASVADAQLLIVDGDTRDPGSLVDDPVIHAHLAKGGVLMLTDAKAAHKQADLLGLVLASHPGDSHAVLMRRALDRNGRPEMFMLEFPVTPGQHAPSQNELTLFRGSVAGFMNPPQQKVGNFNPPAGLLYVIFNFTIPTQSAPLGPTEGGDDTQNVPQHTGGVWTYKYTLLLENGQVVTGDRQFLVIESQVDSSPINQALGTSAIAANKTGSAFSTSNIGWFQVQLAAQIKPDNAASFQYQTDGPQNANQVTTVTTDVQFGVNFTEPFGGGTNNFTYSGQDSEQLTAWEVVNATNGGIGNWTWINQDPWMYNDPSRWGGRGFGGGLHGLGEFREPNTIAMNQLVADARIVYATPSVLSSIESFDHVTTINYLNVWDKGGGVKSAIRGMQIHNVWTIDMSAVLPIPIQSITFSANPVSAKATDKVTGTITLQSPAKVDTTVLVKSNSENATVLSSVTIPMGKASVDFGIQVNSNNLGPGDSTVATIQAYAGFGYQTQLTITN